MILVTGGTGLVGSHLLFKLLKKHNEIRAIYRREHKLEVVKQVFSYYTDQPNSYYDRIDWLEADLNDIEALTSAFHDIDFVYHCAAFVSFEPDKYHQLRKINIEGTANIVNLSISHNVKKICYVSSVAAIGHNLNPDLPITETTEWNQEFDNSVYAITKYGAELEVWRGSQEGVDTVVVNPGIIVGPGFWHSGGSSALFKQVYKGLPYYTDGSSGYVDIDDVVNSMISLMESNIVNERYILVAENLGFKEFINSVANSLGVKSPTKKATPAMLNFAWRMDWLKNKLLGKRRRLSKQMAQSLKSKTLYDNSKIKSAISLSFTPIQRSIEETAKLFLSDLKK